MSESKIIVRFDTQIIDAIDTVPDWAESAVLQAMRELGGDAFDRLSVQITIVKRPAIRTDIRSEKA